MNRNNFDKPKVTLDIDIVAFLPKDFNQNFSQILDEKNQTFIQLTQGWQGVARRLPLAEYDKLCFDNLCQNLQKRHFAFTPSLKTCIHNIFATTLIHRPSPICSYDNEMSENSYLVFWRH